MHVAVRSGFGSFTEPEPSALRITVAAQKLSSTTSPTFVTQSTGRCFVPNLPLVAQVVLHSPQSPDL